MPVARRPRKAANPKPPPKYPVKRTPGAKVPTKKR